SMATPSPSATRGFGLRASMLPRQRRRAGAEAAAPGPAARRPRLRSPTASVAKPCAVCRAAEIAMGALVRQGYAWAFGRNSLSYVTEEAATKADGLGIWQAQALPAWEFRAKRWAIAAREAFPKTPESCAIKGMSPQTAGSITCPGAPGTLRSAWCPTKASAGFVPRPRPLLRADGRWRRVEDERLISDRRNRGAPCGRCKADGGAHQDRP